MSWSGPDFLEQVGGTAVEFSPARVLFLAQRVSASGRLWLTRGADIRTIDLDEGAIVGCSGFADLLLELGVQGERTDALSDLIEHAVAQSVNPNDALGVAALRLGAFVVSCEGDEGLMVQFAPNAPGPAQAVALPMSPVELVLAGVRQSQLLVEVRGWVLAEGDKVPVVMPPRDAPRQRWGLGNNALDLFDQVESAGRVNSIKVDGEAGWVDLAAMRLLGLVGTGEDVRAASTEVASPPRDSEPVSEPAPPTPPPVSSAERTEGEPRQRFDRPPPRSSQKRGGKQRKRRIRKNKLVEALGRSPWQSDPEEVETHLKAAYDAIGASRPEMALGIAKTAELETEVIEQRYRDACARYHPDRYLGGSQAVRALAEGCFSRISEAYHVLKEPGNLEQARERLVFRETGKRPINDKSRARSRVDFKRAEMLFRQRRYQDAAKSAQRAHEGDPERWEYSLLHLRSSWRAGVQDTQSVVSGILEIQGMPSTQRAEALYLAGEMLLKEGRKKEAYGLFHQSVNTDPENVGARRRIRLNESRKTEEEKKKKPSRPLFGGLFGRRGD